MLHTNIPPTTCPKCGLDCQTASHPGGATPSPGDLALCFHCGTLLTFTDTLELRLMTPDEEADIPADAAEILSDMRARLEFTKKHYHSEMN